MTDRALQRKIHVACRQLGLDGDARHDLQLQATGKASMTDMSDMDLKRVLKALVNAGFKATKSNRHKAAPRADLRLVHVLWGKLGDAGKLKHPGRAGLNAFIQSRFGNVWGSVPVDVDTLRDHQQIAAVVRALKDWCQREDVVLDLGRLRK